MSVTSVPVSQDIIDVQRGYFPPTYESYMPYRTVTVKRTYIDAAPGRFQNTEKNGVRKVDNNIHQIGKSLSDDFGLLMKQNVSQKVPEGAE